MQRSRAMVQRAGCLLDEDGLVETGLVKTGLTETGSRKQED